MAGGALVTPVRRSSQAVRPYCRRSSARHGAKSRSSATPQSTPTEGSPSFWRLCLIGADTPGGDLQLTPGWWVLGFATEPSAPIPLSMWSMIQPALSSVQLHVSSAIAEQSAEGGQRIGVQERTAREISRALFQLARRVHGPEYATTPATVVGLHHLELWVPDLNRATAQWGWLLTELGYTPYQQWSAGRSWRLGPTYLAIEQSPNLAAAEHHRQRPGLNHVAFHAGSRHDVDHLVTQAPAHGWTLLFPDQHPTPAAPTNTLHIWSTPTTTKSN